jgi:hypothetical protein
VLNTAPPIPSNTVVDVRLQNCRTSEVTSEVAVVRAVIHYVTRLKHRREPENAALFSGFSPIEGEGIVVGARARDV